MREPLERLIEDGFAGRREPGSAEFEQFADVTARRPSGEPGAGHYRDPKRARGVFQDGARPAELSADGFSAIFRKAGFSEVSVDEQQNEQRVRAVAVPFSS